MDNFEVVQQRLGIELPESYRWAVEDVGLDGANGYTFYDLDELCWYRDHPHSDVVDLAGDAVVIGEDLLGNALVLLAFPVAGNLTLSDEVYLLDADGDGPEEVAMDLAELLEDGLVPAPLPERLFEVAFGVAASRDAVIGAVGEALTARGYEPADERTVGDRLLISVLGENRVYVWLHETTSSSLWLGRRLALLLEQPVTGWEVILRTQLAALGADEQEYPVTARKVEIDAAGLMKDVDTGFNREGANDGDPETTATNVLWRLIDDRNRGFPDTLTFIHPPPPPDVSPRLETILAAISESDAVSLTEIAGQRAVRIELADGTTQMSVVNDEELATLRRHADVP